MRRSERNHPNTPRDKSDNMDVDTEEMRTECGGREGQHRSKGGAMIDLNTEPMDMAIVLHTNTTMLNHLTTTSPSQAWRTNVNLPPTPDEGTNPENTRSIPLPIHTVTLPIKPHKTETITHHYPHTTQTISIPEIMTKPHQASTLYLSHHNAEPSNHPMITQLPDSPCQPPNRNHRNRPKPYTVENPPETSPKAPNIENQRLESGLSPFMNRMLLKRPPRGDRPGTKLNQTDEDR